MAYLIEQGADIKAADNNGLTALDAAMGKTGGGGGRSAAGAVRAETAKLIQDLMLQQGIQY